MRHNGLMGQQSLGTCKGWYPLPRPSWFPKGWSQPSSTILNYNPHVSFLPWWREEGVFSFQNFLFWNFQFQKNIFLLYNSWNTEWECMQLIKPGWSIYNLLTHLTNYLSSFSSPSCTECILGRLKIHFISIFTVVKKNIIRELALLWIQ